MDERTAESEAGAATGAASRGTAIRILYVDDYDLDRALVRDALEHERDPAEPPLHLVEAASRQEFEARLAEGEYDVVLSDFHIGGFIGTQVIDAVRQRSADTPVIIVTGTGSESVAVEAMRHGAADYVIKSPRHLRRLPSVILSALERQQLVRENRQAQQALLTAARAWRATFDAIGDGVALLDRDGRILRCNRSMASLVGRSWSELVGAECGEVVERALGTSELCLVRRVWETHRRETTIIRTGQRGPIGPADRTASSTDDRWFAATVDPVLDEEGELVGAVHILSDVTDRQRAEEQVRQNAATLSRLHAELQRSAAELEQRAERLRTLIEIDRAILAAQSAEETARAALHRIRRLVPCQQAAVAVFDFEEGVIRVLARQDAGSAGGSPADGPPPSLRELVAAGDLRLAPARYVEDVWALAPGDQAALLGEHLLSRRTRSLLAVSLLAEGEPSGLLALGADEPATFSATHVDIAREVADQLAVAIHNAQLFEEVRLGRERLAALSRHLVAAQEAESRRIAIELHDEVGQLLTGLKLALGMAHRLPGEAARTGLAEAQALADELMRRVRNLSLDLRPGMLDDLGLLPALLWYAERYTLRTGIRVSVEHVGVERRFPPELETAAYRIAQEALTNVARHAGVGEATVRLWADDEVLGLSVEDRGAGFDPAAKLAANASSGLAGMRERAALLSGHLLVESAPGRGTRVIGELPLASPEPPRQAGAAPRLPRPSEAATEADDTAGASPGGL